MNGDGVTQLVVGHTGSRTLAMVTPSAGGFASTYRELCGPLRALAVGNIGRPDGIDELVLATAGCGGGAAADTELQIFHGGRGSLLSESTRLGLGDDVSLLTIGPSSTSASWVVAAHGQGLKAIVLDDNLSGLENWSTYDVVLAAPITDIDIAGWLPRGGFELPQSVGITTADGQLFDLALDRRSASAPTLSWLADLGQGVDQVTRASLPATAGTPLLAWGAQGTGLRVGSTGTGMTTTLVDKATAGDIVAIAAMRLNADAIDDLIILRSDASSPTVLLSASVEFTVDAADNAGDECPGDGVCASINAIPGICNDPPSACTLRAAGQELTDLGVPGTVLFDLPGTSAIDLTGPLNPSFSTPVVIDGTSQPGFGGEPILAVDDPDGAVLLTVRGLSVVRGIAFTGATAGSQTRALDVFCNENIIEGNYFGLSTDGNTGVPNSIGVRVSGFSCGDQGGDNLIGGGSASARNVFGTNTQTAIQIGGTAGAPVVRTRVEGNYIGTDASGTVPVNPRGGVGVSVQGGQTENTRVGGPGAAANVIAGLSGTAIELIGPQTQVVGNWIGADSSGARVLGNGGVGIAINGIADGATIGGAAQSAGNIIVAGGDDAIINDAASTSILGNRIGIDGAGNPAGNSGAAIRTPGSDHRLVVGGVQPGEANIIAHNGSHGIVTTGNSFSRTSFVARGNEFFANGGLAIDLEDDGVTLNDNESADDDNGPNFLLNYPEFVSTEINGPDLRIQGRLVSSPNSDYAIDVFASTSCDPSGFGEGEFFLGSLAAATDSTGEALFSGVVAAAGVSPAMVITGTTSDSANEITSEFGPCAAAVIAEVIFSSGFE
ncbi:MAG: hypothetical protein AAGA23_05285 [Pseudomonadota bacterium]